MATPQGNDGSTAISHLDKIKAWIDDPQPLVKNGVMRPQPFPAILLTSETVRSDLQEALIYAVSKLKDTYIESGRARDSGPIDIPGLVQEFGVHPAAEAPRLKEEMMSDDHAKGIRAVDVDEIRTRDHGLKLTIMAVARVTALLKRHSEASKDDTLLNFERPDKEQERRKVKKEQAKYR